MAGRQRPAGAAETAGEDDPAKRLLALPLPDNDSGASTVGGYLAEVLAWLWTGSGSYNGRPFANTEWRRDVRSALSDAGLLAALPGREGALPDERADTLILGAIHAMGRQS